MYHGNSFSFFLKFFFPKSKLFFNIRHSLPNYKFENIKNLISIYISKIFSKYTNCCVYNSLTSKQTHEHIGYGGNSIILRNGFYFEKKNRNKKPFFIKDESLIIGIVSRFHQIKGHEVFLQALKKLKQKKFTVIFIGKGTGSNKFKEFVKSYNLNTKFIYIDEVFYPKNYTASMDLIINASYSESMPNIIGESFSQEIFAIASDVGDTHLYFSDKRFLFKSGSPTDLAKKIELFINLNENEKNLIIRNNKKLMIKNFNMKKCSQEYYSLYLNG